MQIIPPLASGRTSSSQVGREGSRMRLINTSAAAYELEADYYLSVLTLRRNPTHFRMKNVSRKKGNNEIQQK